MNKISIGDKFKTNEGCVCIVMKYINATNVEVKFLDKKGHITKTSALSLRRGSLKNPYFPSVCGVGYIGVGIHRPTLNSKKTKVYGLYQDMMVRCYSEKSQDYRPTYKGCTVHPHWHNFQNFADWYYDQKFRDLGYQLDKDLLFKGNKVYSEKTCTLIPKEINVLLINRSNDRGKYPLGVSERRSSGVKYVAQCSGLNKRLIGIFNTVEEASAAYVREKERHVKRVAIRWKDKIEPRAFEALMSWTVY